MKASIFVVLAKQSVIPDSWVTEHWICDDVESAPAGTIPLGRESVYGVKSWLKFNGYRECTLTDRTVDELLLAKDRLLWKLLVYYYASDGLPIKHQWYGPL